MPSISNRKKVVFVIVFKKKTLGKFLKNFFSFQEDSEIFFESRDKLSFECLVECIILQYQLDLWSHSTTDMRDVFRSPSGICDGTSFFEKSQRLLFINHSQKSPSQTFKWIPAAPQIAQSVLPLPHFLQMVLYFNAFHYSLT